MFEIKRRATRFIEDKTRAMALSTTLRAGPRYITHFTSRLYFFSTSRNRSWGSAITV